MRQSPMDGANDMIAAIHQPNLFPRLKVLQKLALADVWIVLDDVQFAQREYQNRTMLVPNHGTGAPHWLTLPVTLPYGRSTRINDVTMDAGVCWRKLEHALTYSFVATPEFRPQRDALMCGLRQASANLIDLGVASAMSLLQLAGVAPRVVRSSELRLPECSRSSRLALLSDAVGADAYLSGSGGAHYMEPEVFEWLGIGLLWQEWRAPQGPAAQEIGIHIRDGSALNLLARSRAEFCAAVVAGDYTRSRPYRAAV